MLICTSIVPNSDLCALRRRDWASLSFGPAVLIAERVLSANLADYVRLRAVCSTWRRCTEDPRADARGGALDRRFHPRQWIMLDDSVGRVRPRHSRFLNVSTGDCVRMELPELTGRVVLAPTPEGLLLLLNDDETHAVCLLNPLTGSRTDLPPATALLSGYKPDRFFQRSTGNEEALEVYGVGITHDSTVVVNFGEHRQLAVARPGNDHWTRMRCEEDRIGGPILSFAGRVYCIVCETVMVVETSPDEHPPRLAKVAMIGDPIERSSRPLLNVLDTLHLVDNGGELMVVHRIPRIAFISFDIYTICEKSYRVDLEAGTTTIVNGNFGGRKLFIGMRRTLAVPAGLAPFITAESDCVRMDRGKERVQPHTVVLLSAFAGTSAATKDADSPTHCISKF